MIRTLLLLLSIWLVSTISLPQALGQQPQTKTRAATAAVSQAAINESLQNLGRVVEQYIENNRAVGAELLIIQKGQTLYHESFGYSDREAERRWENDTICNIRSMTKPITSAAAQILIDRKLLNLDDPVSKYLESFDNDQSKAITVRQVLTHRSGLPLTNLLAPYQYPSLVEQVAAAGKRGPQFEPGSKFWYSDIGTDVVGALVEKVSGEPLQQFVKREIFDPLGMSSTLYGIDAADKRFSQIASLYIKGSKEWFRFWKPEAKPFYPFAWGSQTVYSTTTDYAKFLKMMMNRGRAGDRQLLSTAAVDRMLEPVSRMKMLGSDASYPTGFRDLQVFYGQMMVTHRPKGKEKEQPVVIGHSGSDGTNAWAWPERDLMILYFTQSRGGPTALRIERPIDRLIIHPGEELAQEEAPKRLRPYLGTFIANYDSFDNEEFTVRARNGKLILDVPSQMAFELMEPDEQGYWAFEIVPDQVKATFDRNEKNEVVGLKLHKAGQVYEVPRKGTARAKELSGNAVNQESATTSESESTSDFKTTTWKGTLETQAGKLRLEIGITEYAGKLTGELTSLDQNNVKLKTTEIKSDGDSLSFSIPGASAKFSGKLTNNGGVAEGTFTQRGRDLPLTLSKSDEQAAAPQTKSTEKLKQAWIGQLEMGIMKPVMQFRIVTLESGETAAYFDSVTEGRTGFEATWSIDGDQLKFDVAKIKLKYRGTLNDRRDTAQGTWSQGGRNIPLTLKSQATPYDSVNVWKNRPQRPIGPFPYDAEEVTFENQADSLTLAGTLTIPKKPGRHPVVVLISGSGPQDRDESLMEHKPFLVLADYLSRRGIAVLRYDDRGTAASSGKFGPATTEDFARDASAAVEFLKSHERINAKEIGLAGHSEGGLIAPMVVAQRDDVAFVVLMAATGVDGATINESQTEAMLRAAGTSEVEIEIALAVNRAVIGVAMKASPGADVSEELDKALEPVIQTLPESDREEAGQKIRAEVRSQIGRLQGNWMRFFLAYDPRPALQKIQCPVLAIIGSKDLQVLPDLNMPEIKQALTAGGNQDFEIIELAGLNHLFQQCETGSMDEYVTIQETFNPLALEKIGDWIIRHTNPVK